MQKMLLAALAAVFVSCGSGDKKADEPEKKEPMAATPMNMYGYTPTYSASFEMGDPKQAEMILSLWKDWDNGDLSVSKSQFADTVHFYTGDGSVIEGPRDSAIAATQQYRNMFSSVKSTVHAIFPVKSTDKNQNWVCIWGSEVHTDKAGKTDSMYLQETWRFKDGKIDLLYQHQRPYAPMHK
jgi:hypothetical protein